MPESNVFNSPFGLDAEALTSVYSGPIDARWYGAKFDGTTDDTAALTAWLNAVMASASRWGVMSSGTAPITAALPTINVSGVRLQSVGVGGIHDVGTMPNTVIKYTGVAGATMLTIKPDDGVSTQRLAGIVLEGVTFDCNALAAKGVVYKSASYGTLNFGVMNATSIGFETGVVTTLGEAKDLQFNNIRYWGRQVDGAGASGISMVLGGDAAANTSFNVFESVDIQHYDALGIREDNADNNLWHNTRVYRVTGGSATNSIEWRGGTSLAVACRAEMFHRLSTTVAAIAKGTGTYTVGAQRIFIQQLDDENGTPVPTVETGAVVEGVWLALTPTPTSGTGTLTTASATMRYRREGQKVFFIVVVSITTAGSAATSIIVPLPVAASNATGALSINAGLELATSVGLLGYIGQGATTLIIRRGTDGAYVGADGNILAVSGVYAVAALA